MNLIFEDDDAASFNVMNDKLVGRMKSDVVAIACELSHQVGPASDHPRPSRKFVEKFKNGIFGNRVEIVLAVNETDKSLLNHIKERIESNEIRRIWPSALVVTVRLTNVVLHISRDAYLKKERRLNSPTNTTVSNEKSSQNEAFGPGCGLWK